MTTYAIISLGGKQYRVQEGQRLVVDRVPYAESKTFHPTVLFVGGDGRADAAPKGVEVTARVVGHVLGDKLRIGKYRPKTGYRRHTGHRSRLSQITIEAIGTKAQAKPKAEPAAPAKEKEKEPEKAPAKPKAEAKEKAAAPKKPAASAKKKAE